MGKVLVLKLFKHLGVLPIGVPFVHHLMNRDRSSVIERLQSGDEVCVLGRLVGVVGVSNCNVRDTVFDRVEVLYVPTQEGCSRRNSVAIAAPGAQEVDEFSIHVNLSLQSVV
jgi:hypothetical protein